MAITSASPPMRGPLRSEARLSPWSAEIVTPLLCSLALIACIVIANPFVNSAFDDDWSYADTALRLAQSGSIHYSGWGSPTILFQSVWAALFIRAFGFSFNLLRLISIPFSAGLVCLTYFLGRRLGLRPSFAGFAALTLAVSPLFVPLAASFMTEPYACFFTLACVYAAIAAAESRSDSLAVRWLWVLGISGILGGSDRQTVWLLPLLLLPYLAWLRRSNRRFLIHSAIAYSVCLGSLAFVLLHFHTGYAVSDMSRKQWIVTAYTNFAAGIHSVGSVLLLAALMCLPPLLFAAPFYRRLGLRTTAAIAALCLVIFDYLRSGFGDSPGVAPFLGSIVTSYGVLDHVTGLGSRPEIFHIYERYPITFLLIFAVAVWAYLLKAGSGRLTLPSTTTRILLIFAVPYICLLLPGAILTFCWDRYALTLLPVMVVLVLVPFQDLISRIPAAAWASLVVFALFGISTTHDYARYLQARATAIELSEKKGVSRMHIAAGVESDGWTQVQSTGNIGHVLYGVNPGDRRHPWFSYYATAVRPDYVTWFSPRADIPRTTLVTVAFFNWLPPSFQAISVLKPADIPERSQ
jgi:hypothetical protein